jgi:hypothetical protein
MRFRQSGGNRIEIRLRLLEGNAGFQARDRLEEMIAALRSDRFATLGVTFDRDRGPDFDRIVLHRKLECGGHDADDLVIVRVERDGVAEHSRIAAEVALPYGMAQENDTISRLILLRQKGSPHRAGWARRSGKRSAETTAP